MNCGATAAFSTLRRSGSPTRLRSWIGAVGASLVRHERLALVMPWRSCRRGRVGRRFRLVRQRLWRRLRRGVILRRRRDDNHHRRKILAGGGKRRANGDQRKRSGKSNDVRLHRHVSCLGFSRRAARPIDARAAEEIPSGAAPTHSPIRAASCASERRLASLDRSETISAHRPEGPSPSSTISCAKSGILRSQRER
jgi:hypothetical protein